MNLSNLTKEQKKYIGIGGGISAIVLTLGLVGIRLSFSSISEIKDELEGLNGKIEKAERAVEKLARVEENYDQSVVTIKSHFENIPPSRNYYSWATEIIYGEGRISMLEIEAVDEINTPDKTVDLAGTVPIQFEAYRLRVVAKGNYSQIKIFIANVEEKYPLARFTDLEINASENKEQHSVQLFVEWPMYPQQIERVWASVETIQRKRLKRPSQQQKPTIKVAEAEVIPQPEQRVAERPVQKTVHAPKKPVVNAAPNVVKPVAQAPVAIAKTEAPVTPPAQKTAPTVSSQKFMKPVISPAGPYDKVASEPMVKSPAPAPVVAKKEPVSSPPSVDSIPEPQSELTPAPLVEEPVKFQPKVAVQPEPVKEPSPVFEDPVPVVAKNVQEPVPVEIPVETPKVVSTEKPKPETPVVETPAEKDDSLESILASLSDHENKTLEQPEEPAVAVATPTDSMNQPEQQDDELSSLLASLEAENVEPKEEKSTVTPVVNPMESADMELESLLAAHAQNVPQDNQISEPIPEVVAAPEPELIPVTATDPAPVSEPQLVEHDVDARPVDQESVAEPKDNMADLLASLGSHGMDKKEGRSETPDSASPSDSEDLEAFLKQLEDEKKSIEQQPSVPPEPIVAKPVEKVADEYVSTAKSATILAALLNKEEPVEAGSLSSFLDTIVEDIND